MAWYPCPACCGGEQTCPCCSSAEPDELLVTIAGLADDECSSCENLNGAFVCAKVAPCYWRYEDIVGPCDSEEFPQTVSLSVLVGRKQNGTCYLAVFWEFSTTTSPCAAGFDSEDCYTFVEYFDDPFDCANLDRDVPLLPTRIIAFGCDESAATCHVTAL